jgi:hypothetical protein
MGCPLSPLMGAIYLKPLDDRMAPLTRAEQGRTGVFYVRFMDDWVVMAPTRWKLRSAVKCVNETMAELKMEQHPNKTFVGRISRGFDFLGYRISTAGLIGLAAQSVQQTTDRMSRLYEQGADDVRIGRYVRRWWAWVRGGICREFPPELLPVALQEALGGNGLMIPLGDLPAASLSSLSPPQATRGQATNSEGHEADAGGLGNVGGGPGIAHHVAGGQ